MCHWSKEGDVELAKKFDIVPEERQAQVVGYDCIFLQGIAKGADCIEGVLQLYNVPLNRYNVRDATLFCLTKKDGMSTKLFVVEVGNQDNPLRVCEIQFQQQNDYIVAMVPTSKFGCIYAIQTGRSTFTMFLAVPHGESGGVVTLHRSGRVVNFYVDTENMQYITNTGYMAGRFALAGAGNIFKTHFEHLIVQDQYRGYQQVAKLAADALEGVLRTPETIQKFQTVPNVEGGPLADVSMFPGCGHSHIFRREAELTRSRNDSLHSRTDTTTVNLKLDRLGAVQVSK